MLWRRFLSSASVVSWLVICAPATAADAPIAESRIIAVDLFKNGLAVVKCEIAWPPGIATMLVRDCPEATHGSFWIDSEAPVTVRATTIEVESLPGPPSANLQRELAGIRVSIRIRDEAAPLAATVVEFPPMTQWQPQWDRNYSGQDDFRNRTAIAGGGATAAFLVLQTEHGLRYLDPELIQSIDVLDQPPARTQREPALELALDPASAAKPPSVVRFSYLAKELTWLPAYHIDLHEPARLLVRQQAVIRNELADLDDVTVNLITGYPHIEFANVTSPLGRDANLARFFRQLRAVSDGQEPFNGVVSQTGRSSSPFDESGAVVAPTSEGIDVHYHAAGRRTIAEGESIAFDVASAPADYARIVEWRIPDGRDAHGRILDSRARTGGDVSPDGQPWDAVSFRNPLPFPMTTAPAMITDGDRFAGQSTSRWVAVGDETTLRINRALSILAVCSENEDASVERAEVTIAGQRYPKVTVKGELRVTNRRNEAVDFVMRREFSGELHEADGSPVQTLREAGVYSVNRRNQLTWRFELAAGEERIVKYQYDVLVAR